ncbi:MAG: hypothetical protein AAFR77_07715, partial [Cyanobacteria bacterium J06631_2]
MIERNYLKHLKCLTAIAIALSLPSPVQGQSKTDSPDNPFDSIQQQFASPWESAILSGSLESTTQISAMQFSPDGQTIASVGASQITLWDVNNGEIQRVLPGHYASSIKLEIAPTAIAFSPDSKFLASSTWSQGLLSPDQAIKIRDVVTGEEVLSLDDPGGCRQILFNPSGDIIYGACETGVTAWSFPGGKKLFSFDLEYPVEAIALSSDGAVMATVDANVIAGSQGEKSNQIQLWQLDSGKPKLLNTLDGHDNEIVRLQFATDGKRLVSSSYDGKINIWNWQQGTIGRNNSFYSDQGVFSLNRNSQLIAGNFHSSTMTSLVTGLPLRNTRKLRQEKVASIMAFHPQSQIFAEVANKIDGNSSINFWSVDDSQLAPQPSVKDGYRTIPFIKYWTSQENQPPSQSLELPSRKSSIGKDPQ